MKDINAYTTFASQQLLLPLGVNLVAETISCFLSRGFLINV